MNAPLGAAPERIWLAVEAVEHRLGIDGLSARIQASLGRSPCDGTAYAFTNRRHSRLKLLVWDGTGVWLSQRRLHRGYFTWPSASDPVFALTAAQWRWRGEPPVFNPRDLDFARHYGFEIVACNVCRGNEKGRAERGVGYVKHNFLQGRELPEFAALNSAAAPWLETVANVRVHGETHRRPVDLWTEERAFLQAVNPRPFDVGKVLTARADRQFRVTFEGNRYSVPARFAGCPVVLKAYPDRLCVYREEQLSLLQNSPGASCCAAAFALRERFLLRAKPVRLSG